MRPTKIPGGVYLSTQQAAERLGYTAGRVRQLIAAGELRAYSLSPRLYLIPVSAVETRLANMPTLGRPRSG